MSTKHADYRHSQQKSVEPTTDGCHLVLVDTLTRVGKQFEGSFKPSDLGGLSEYLAGNAGKITYQIRGNIVSDQSGSQKKRLQCIILGWFEVLDAITLQPSRFDLDIESHLVLVSSERELPPLEDESDHEDYIVCGREFDVLSHVQEEILLVLPITTPRSGALPEMTLPKSLRVVGRNVAGSEKETQRESPFAKLQALKKSR
ncbi:MAG: YceD family protein [Betaproteobacteria bacterium]|jgi:uncharacterized protein